MNQVGKAMLANGDRQVVAEPVHVKVMVDALS